MKTLYDSFRDYVAVEMLDGENKYQAEGFGLQDARKGIIFQSLPPVLHLQLKRYEYDMQRDAMVKVRAIYSQRASDIILTPPQRSMIALSSHSRLTLTNSSTRRLTGPNLGSTSFTASSFTLVTYTAGTTSLSSNRIGKPGGSNLTMTG